MSEDWSKVGKAIADRIEQLRLTKAEVIRRSGVSDKTLDGYIDGAPIVRKDKQRGICEALEWTPESIDRLLDGGEAVPLPAISPQIDRRLSVLERRADQTEETLAELRDVVHQALGQAR